MFGTVSSKQLLMAAVSVATVCVALPASAQVRTFDIQAQAATTGVPQLALQSGLQIIAPQADLAGRRIAAVKGQMDALDAVRQALAGSGLVIASRDGAVLVLRAAAIPAAAPVEQVDEVIVTASPIVQSLTRSLDIQRRADNVKSAIAADAIGRFPDQTAAAALARLPGVAVQRDQGQERYVQVRGAPTRWTSVAFNGMPILGAEDRVFRFDAVPSPLIDQVELNKTLTPAMSAEALAGQVDIRTYSPLAHPGFHLQASAGAGFVDLGDGPQRQYSGRVSWANDRLGVVLAGSHFLFEQQTDNTEPRFDAGGMSQVRAAKYVIGRETNSLSGAIEYQIADGHKLSFNSLYSEFIDDEERNQYTFYLNGGVGTRSATAGRLTDVEVRGLFNKGGQKTSLTYNVLRGEHAVLGGDLTWDLARNESVLESGSPLIEQRQSAGLRPSLSFTTDGRGMPSFTLYDTARAGGVSSFGARRTGLDQMAFDQETITWSGSSRETTENLAKIDYGRDYSSFGANSRLQVGLQYNDREFVDVGSYSNVTPAGVAGGAFNARAVAAALGVAWTPLQMVTSRAVDEDFDRGFTFNYIDNAGMRAQAEALFDAARAANARGGSYAVPQLIATNTSRINEEMLAVYAQNTWRWSNQTVLAGVRVERAKLGAEGFATVGGVPQPLSLENTTTKVFPSIHWNMDVRDDLKVRAALVSGSSRPSFGALSSNVSINDANATVSGGNPELKPETAWGIDSSIEWYFAPASILSANVFYRNVQDVLFGSTTKVGDARLNSGGFDRAGYDYSTTVNGDDGKLYGLELTYSQPFRFLPGALSGFGVDSSLTFLDGEFTTPAGRKVGFPGTSKRIASVTAFYEKYGLSARLSYQRRSPWLDEVGATAAADFWWETSERLDFSARYQINPNFSVFLDANNLTDEEGFRWQGDRSRPYEQEGYGRRFLAGVRINF